MSKHTHFTFLQIHFPTLYKLSLSAVKDVRSCVLCTFLDRYPISKFLHHISFIPVNLGFPVPIKLYSIKKNRDTITDNKHQMGEMFCSGRFLGGKY